MGSFDPGTGGSRGKGPVGPHMLSSILKRFIPPFSGAVANIFVFILILGIITYIIFLTNIQDNHDTFLYIRRPQEALR